MSSQQVQYKTRELLGYRYHSYRRKGNSITPKLKKLGEHFGKKLLATPTLHRKQIATTVAMEGIESDVRGSEPHDPLD